MQLNKVGVNGMKRSYAFSIAQCGTTRVYFAESEPADTAGAVSFLCMPAAAYITGQVLAVDGGLAAQGFRGPCVVPHEPPAGAAAAARDGAEPSSKRRKA